MPIAEVLAMPCRSESQRESFMAALEALVFGSLGSRRLVAAAFSPAAERKCRVAARRKVPETVQMILVLYWLWLDVRSGGITQFLDDGGAGAECRRAALWSDRIGARRAASYVRAAAALAPRGVVPREVQKRRHLVNALLRRRPDPLDTLDQRYRKVTEEIAPRLQVYVRRNSSELRAWVEAEHRVEVQTAAAKAEESVRRARARKPAVRASPAESRPRRPTGARVGRRDGERFARTFLRDLAALSRDDWLVVARRYRSSEQTLLEADSEVVRAIVAIVHATATPVGRTRKAWSAARQALRVRAQEIVDAVPETVKEEGRTRLLRIDAERAVFLAQNAVSMYAELCRTRRGQEAARALLAPFEGFVSPP